LINFTLKTWVCKDQVFQHLAGIIESLGSEIDPKALDFGLNWGVVYVDRRALRVKQSGCKEREWQTPLCEQGFAP
jgi:hypothetical protein